MKKRPLCVWCILLIAVQVFLSVAGVGKETPVTCLLEKNINTNLNAGGQVYKKERHTNYQILYLKDAYILCQNQKISKLKIIIYDEKFKEVSLGNQVTASGEWMPFEEPRNHGNYNQKFYYEKQGVSVAVWGNEIKKVSGKTWKIRDWLAVFRERWHTVLCQVLGEKNGGMLSAMILGEKRELDQEWKELYQVNGIGHLLAISGLHLSFVGLTIYQMLRRAGLTYVEAGMIGGTILALYTVMTGLSVSAIRALTMFLIRIGADMSGREYDILTNLSVAAAIVISWQPLYAYDAGFLLSFGAILGIIFMYPFVKKLMPYRWKYLDGLAASLSIQIFLFPITLYFFYEIPLYSVFLNIIVIPLMSFLLGIGFIGSLFYFCIPQAGMFILKFSRIIFDVYDGLCQKTIEVPYARIVLGKPKWWQVVLYYLILVLFVWIMEKRIEKKEKNKERWKRSGVFATLILISIVAVPHHSGKGMLDVAMLDVGQGDGIFVKGPTGVTYFVDGGSSDVKNVGKYRIESFLKSQGVGELDYVFISHGDADHMSGIEEMMERQKIGIKIHNLVLPEKRVWDESLKRLAQKAFQYGTKVSVIKEKEEIREGELSITCVLPERTYVGETGNASSMVLLFQYGSFDMLMTGDVEGKGEEALENVMFPGKIDVLKVAHHGSKNSTSEKVLEHLNPDIGLISAGIGNHYGHPHQEILDRLKEKGMDVYNTQQCGEIWLETDGECIQIETYKRRN